MLRHLVVLTIVVYGINAQFEEDVVFKCNMRYGASYCNALGAACSQATKVPIPPQMSGGEYLLPQPILKCMEAEMDNPSYMWQCIQTYDTQSCDQLASFCSMKTKHPLPRDLIWQMPQPVVDCMATELQKPAPVWRCALKYDEEFCNKLATACSQVTGAFMTPMMTNQVPTAVADCMSSEDTKALCYADIGHEYCQGDAPRCRKPDAPRGSPLSVTELECMKSQIAMDRCKTVYKKHCQALQEECVTASGVRKISTDEKGLYQMSASVRSCITNGGVMATCRMNHNAAQCAQWESQCANALRSAPGQMVLGFYHKMQPQLALCVGSQDLMNRCISLMGLNECKKKENDCKRRVASPTQSLPAPLYTFTSGLVSCVARQVKA